MCHDEANDDKLTHVLQLPTVHLQGGYMSMVPDQDVLYMLVSNFYMLHVPDQTHDQHILVRLFMCSTFYFLFFMF